MPATDLIEHERVLVRGLCFHVARARPRDGERPRPLLLFLHGFPENWYSWRHQLAFFGGRFDCAAPDTRGYGETDKPEGGYDVDSLADDAAALIGALGYDEAVVIGHDWGAVTAWHLAARHPQWVRKLVVINCPPADVMRRHLLSNLRQIKRSSYIFAFQLPGIETILAANGARSIRRALETNSRRAETFSEADLAHYCRSILRPAALRCALSYYRTMLRDALHPRRYRRLTDVGPITMPTLLLWGKDDPALGCELTHGLEARCQAGLTIRFIDDCGHFTQQEAPAEVNDAIDRFVDESP